MRIAINLLLLLLVCLFCNAQKEATDWILSYGNRIKFNSGGGVTNQPPPGIYSDATASIANANGNLLFFSNGVKIFDKNFTPMPVFASPASIMEHLNRDLQIAPYPGQPGKYFLFYTSLFSFGASYTLKYAV